MVDDCPVGAAQMTDGQNWNQPCSSNWPTSETQGLYALYSVMVLGILGTAYAVSSFGQHMPVYWREAASGSSQLAYFVANNAIDTGLAAAFAFFFLAAYAAVADPWGAFGTYFALTFMMLWTNFGLGYLTSFVLARSNAAVTSVLCAMVMGVFSGMAFQRTPTYSFFYSEAIWRAEASLVIHNAHPSDLYWISVYASNNYGYHIDAGVTANALKWMALYGGGLRLLAFLCMIFRHRSKQR